MTNSTHTRISEEVKRELDRLARKCAEIEDKQISRTEVLRRMVHPDIKQLILKDSEIKRRLKLDR